MALPRGWRARLGGLLPASLFGRMLLILFLGLFILQLTAIGFIVAERIRLGDKGGAPPSAAAVAVPRGPGPPPPARVVVAYFVLLAAGVGVFSFLAVRLATRPLKRLAEAAERLGRDPDPEPLEEDGPSEVAAAACAFNRMQIRLQRHLAERTHILAAVSHDLQTPITRMRLRAELLDDTKLKEKFLADLDAMQCLVEQGLVYAQAADTATPGEALRRVDARTLLESLACDYADAGKPLLLSGAVPEVVLVTRPQALRRILGNLVDNALKFAGNATLQAELEDDALAVAVRDAGPGISAEELEKVLQPFYRLETSRSRETGGSGLGLAICLQLAQSLGAGLSLRNLPEGGLEARLRLPLQAPGAAENRGD